MAELRVPLPDAQSKSYACSCGRYGPGNAYGVSTHRSKTKCGGHVLVILDVPAAEAAGDQPAEATSAAEPTVAATSPDMVVVDGQTASGRLVEPKGGAPTAFRQQVETTAELRTYYDFFHVAMKYEGDFSRWLEEMARLAVEELFGLELTMRVRQRQQEQERKSA